MTSYIMPVIGLLALLAGTSRALPSTSRLTSTPKDTPVFPVINEHGLLANSTDFTLNGTKYRILSGAIHYFRVPHEYWQDRLERLVALGLNTVETYVAWNLHEPSPGNVDFTGELDIRQFIKTSQSLGLNVILRPGPFICAEWDFGGLPSWLLRDPKMKVRTTYAPYMQAVDTFLEKLFEQVGDLQYMNGGPIIAIQVENEYGSFGRDLEYVKAMGNLLLKHNATELLFTADNDGGRDAGRVPGVLEMLTGQKGMAASLADLRRLQPNMPLMVIEFWSGWFDHWGEPNHHTYALDDYLRQLDTILIENNASINFYMAHGGTSFGFMAGANTELTAGDIWAYGADTTSYDYDAPISEDGSLHPTKYNATREFLSRVSNQPLPPLPAAPVHRAYGNVSADGFLRLYPETSSTHELISNSLLDFVTRKQSLQDVKPMELLDIDNGAGQQYGYILYRKDLTDLDPRKTCGTKIATLTIKGGIRDRLSLTYAGMPQDGPFPKILAVQQDAPLNVDLGNAIFGNMLNVLVENRGRVNFAQKEWTTRDVLDTQRKGLQATVDFTYNDTKTPLLGNWTVYPLDFKRDFMQTLIEDTDKKFEPISSETTRNYFPAMLRYTVDIGEDVQDSFLYVPPAIVKGVAFVNGRNLGRFWQIGPQKTLYVPKWFWNAPTSGGGKNVVMIFAEEAHPKSPVTDDFTIELRDSSDLGPVAKA